MKRTLQKTAALGIFSVAMLSPVNPLVADSTMTASSDAVSEGQQIHLSNILVKTEKYLVPKNVCPDVEAAKYEDCVPWSYVGDSILLALP